MKYADIEALLRENEIERALKALEVYAADDARANYLRGRICWRQGDKAGAMSYYKRAADADPDSPAVIALEQARGIMAFFNKDLYNP